MNVTNAAEKMNLIAEALTAKGLAFQVAENNTEYIFGFTNGRGVWHWFELCKLTPGAYVIFKISHSLNTGRKNSAINQSLKVKATLTHYIGEKLLKAEITA